MLKNTLKRFIGLSVSSILALAVAITPLGAAHNHNYQSLPQISNIETSAHYVNPKSQNLRISYYLADDANVTVKIWKGAKMVKALLSKDFQAAGYNTFSWNGKDREGKFVTDGTYIIEVIATNHAGTTEASQVVHANYIPAYPKAKYKYKHNYPNKHGHTYYEPDYNQKSYEEFYDEAAYIKSHYVNKASFNPYHGGVTINFELNQNEEVTIEILGEGFVARKLMKNLMKSGNTLYSVGWNGRNSSGDVVEAGQYKYRITLDNGTQYYGDINVSNPYSHYEKPKYKVKKKHHKKAYKYPSKTKKTYNEPYYKYPKTYSKGDLNVYGEKAEPTVFTPSKKSTKISYILSHHTDSVNVDIYDGYHHIKRLVTNKRQGKGTHKAYWDGTNNVGHKVDAGIYTVRISGKDTSGYDSEEVYVEVKHHYKGKNYKVIRPKVTRDKAKPQTFNPFQEKTKLSYNITEGAFVSLRIMDGSRVMKTLIHEDYQSEGTHSRLWDGKKDNGQYINEGPYEYEIEIYNEDGEDVQRGNVVVDYEGMDYYPGSPVVVKRKPVASTAYLPTYTETTTPVHPCAGFADVNSASKYCDAVTFVKSSGIFNGYDGVYFYPNRAIQRDEAVKVVIEAFNLSTQNADGSNLGLWDLDPYGWYMPYLKTARTLGIIHGYPDGSFKPYATVNRVEFTKMFLETAEKANGIHVPYCNNKPYSDTEATWYTDYVCYAKQHGLIKTKDAWTFEPGRAITRGQVAEFVYNYFGK